MMQNAPSGLRIIRADSGGGGSDGSDHALADHTSEAHDELTGLTDDDHSIYALLAGRAGGQQLIGGTGSGDDLRLSGTSHATKGGVRIEDSFLDFNEIATPGAPSANEVRLWVEDSGGFSVFHFLNGAGTEYQLARDNILVVRNNTGSTLSKGKWVYINGSTGVFPTVALADASSASTLPVMGVVVADIATANFGQVMIGGDVQNVDTSAFNDGDVLYISTTAGDATTTAPTGSDIVQRIGVVIKGGSVGAGIIAVLIGAELNEADIDHGTIAGVTANQHHNEAHTVASHSDTTATGAELETLTNGTDADALHAHSGASLNDDIFVLNAGDTMTGDLLIANAAGQVIGHSSQVAIGGTTPEWQMVGNGIPDRKAAIGSWSTVAGLGAELTLARARNTSIGTFTAVDDDDVVGILSFYAADGTDLATAVATFSVEVDDASPTTGDIGAAYVWKQLPGGAGADRETMRLNAAGNLFLPDSGSVYLDEKAAADADVAGSGQLWVKTATPNELVFTDDAGTDHNFMRPKRSFALTAGSGFPATTSPCAGPTQIEAGTNDVDYVVLDFDATADEYAVFSHPLPDNYDGGTITFKVYWTTSATDADGVAWGLQARAYGDGEAIDQAWGTAVVVTDDAQSAAGEVLITAESSALTIGGTPAGGELVIWRVFRDVSDANDDMTEDARLISVRILYTTEGYSDA